jgi:hypothetical protein
MIDVVGKFLRFSISLGCLSGCWIFWGVDFYGGVVCEVLIDSIFYFRCECIGV